VRSGERLTEVDNCQRHVLRVRISAPAVCEQTLRKEPKACIAKVLLQYLAEIRVVLLDLNLLAVVGEGDHGWVGRHHGGDEPVNLLGKALLLRRWQRGWLRLGQSQALSRKRTDKIAVVNHGHGRFHGLASERNQIVLDRVARKSSVEPRKVPPVTATHPTHVLRGQANSRMDEKLSRERTSSWSDPS
jgi:hypothetical protein